MDATLHELPDDIAGMLPATWDGARIPERMWEPIVAWIMLGRIPGDFLQAVIANDLYEAAARADRENLINIRAYAGFFKTSVPYACRGSRALLDAWSECGGLRGQTELPPRLSSDRRNHGHA